MNCFLSYQDRKYHAQPVFKCAFVFSQLDAAQELTCGYHLSITSRQFAYQFHHFWFSELL